jgi:adenylate cyclase
MSAVVCGMGASRLEPEAVRRQLLHVLGSGDFDASERNRQFLRYAVEETLEGRAQRIKAYAIATSVFGRSKDFDPQMDPIVRIEAGRLRRSLERYYLKAGHEDPIRISIPRGSYAAAFDTSVGAEPYRATSPTSESGPRRLEVRGPSILVTPFEEDGNHSEFPNFTRGLTRHIVVALTRFAHLRVFGPQTVVGHGSPDAGAGPDLTPDVDFILTGAALVEAGNVSIEALLVDARDGRNLWSGAYRRDLETAEMTAVRDELADTVARSLAQTYGVIFSCMAGAVRDSSAKSLSSYDLVVKCFEYERSLATELFEPARAGLERVIASDDQYPAAFAGLSRLYTGAHRYGHDVSAATDDPLGRARELASWAVRLAPASSDAHRALGLALWFSGDLGGALDALETSSALNPNDTESMAERGFRYALLADWKRAEPLLRESFARNPAQPSTYRMGLVLLHYAREEYNQAPAEARKIEAPNVVNLHVVTAAAAARAGLRAEADSEVRSILKIAPDYGERAVADLRSRNLDLDLIRQIVEGLREAGLPVVGPTPIGGQPRALRAI